MKLIDDTRLNINSNIITLLVLFDFTKTLDRLFHKTLLAKLNIMDNTAEWFGSYLKVYNYGKRSDWILIKRGVPQGSVLGLLLFLLFIDDICYFIHNCNRLFYAYDLQIYLKSTSDNLQENIKLENIELKYRLIRLISYSRQYPHFCWFY